MWNFFPENGDVWVVSEAFDPYSFDLNNSQAPEFAA
jgi:hypothetical protein